MESDAYSSGARLFKLCIYSITQELACIIREIAKVLTVNNGLKVESGRVCV